MTNGYHGVFMLWINITEYPEPTCTYESGTDAAGQSIPWIQASLALVHVYASIIHIGYI